LGDFAGFQKTSERGKSGAKQRPFWPKTGQNTGFTVTDSLTWQKCKLLIPCEL
jgi:hypothetical protein